MTEITSKQLNMDLGSAPYNNQYLFADHYLDHILTRTEYWLSGMEDAEAFLNWLRGHYVSECDHLVNYSEAQLEEHWFKPIFEHLGHVYETQARVPGLGSGVRKPDYVFFPTDTARQEAVNAQKSDDYAQHALAVGEVKAWDIHLSKKQRGGGVSFDYQNPSYQIDYYLKATGLTWGILANGRQWRLLHHESSYRLDTYYEVDLISLLERDNASALRYFYLFFRQAAFRFDDQGRRFLDDVLAGSHAYAVALEGDLRNNAYLALEQLIQGFYDYGPNHLTTDDLDIVYENSLYLLYRLLFVLYGESRGLLPVGNRQYRELFGFNRLKQEIATQIDKGITIPKRSRRYYGELWDLFHLINGDDPEFNTELNVVRYNGGLFDPQQHPFLNDKSVGDRAFMQAVDLLCRRTSEDGHKEFADYRTLNVRHLGSIYEGLLEYQPRRATTAMVAVRTNNHKGEQWLPAEDAPQNAKILDRRAPGAIYLETDKGERKATGSYYTPQYVVEYIVEQTLGPLVEQALERIKAAGNTTADGQALVTEILNLKVLDPAMGSGHFLVEATDYLSRALATDPYVQAEEEGPQESDLNHWRRRVVERCIYGVDKNPLSVELAKLSLWLATFVGDKPLGFLDHHLKCGDSLVGAEIADLEERPEVLLSQKAQRQREKEAAAGATQLGLALFSGEFNRRLPEMLRELFSIMDQESSDYEAVQAKEAANARVEHLKAPFIAIANLYTSAHFGNTYSEETYKEALRTIGETETLLELEAVQSAQAIAAEQQFFHWELAFPEVYFDRVGWPLSEKKRGFDAIIGNPPYIVFAKEAKGRQSDFSIYQVISKSEFQFYTDSYPNTAEYAPNTFSLFLEKAFDLLSKFGYQGFIYPSNILYYYYFKNLRDFITTNASITSITQLDQVFTEAETGGNAIIIIQKKSPSPTTTTKLNHISTPTPVNITNSTQQTIQQALFEKMPHCLWITNPVLLNVISKSTEKAIPIEELGEFYQGVCTGDNDKWLTKEQFSPFSKKVLRGRDVNRYSLDWNNLYLIFNKPKMWSNTNELLLASSPKLLIRQTGDSLTAALDREGFFIIDSLYLFLPKNSLDAFYLLSIFNSRLLTVLYQFYCPERNRAFAQVKIINLRPLPIRHINSTTSEAERARLLDKAQSLYNTGDTVNLLTFTAARLAAKPEQADVIHDLLAYLAEQMIELNKQKQQRTSDFYLDLEGITEADTFAKLQKGKHGRTLWKTKACQPFVKEGSHTTHNLEESLAWNEDCFKAFVKKLVGNISNLSQVVGVYRAHTGPYADLTRQINATDRLIDQIVYQLYGLTEEEIAIVEGASQE